MTILLFLVDTSASMAQRNYMGVSALETAKTLVSDLIKQRQRDFQARQGDRYMLFTTDEFPFCVKTGWREGNAILNEQLKALRPCGKYPLKQAILSALYFVNLNRAQSGIDNYAHGRFVTYQEPVVLITICDAHSAQDIAMDFELRPDSPANKHSVPGSDLTEEAFRWDQRLFSIVIRMPSRAPTEPRIAQPPPVSPEAGGIGRICGMTGGRALAMVSHKQQSAIVDLLISCFTVNGVVLNVDLTNQERLGNFTGTSEERKDEMSVEALRKSLEVHPLIYLYTRNRGAQCHWPIPEAFWPEALQNAPKLPPRKAHPLVTVSMVPTEAVVNTEFPFDKFELEQSQLSDYVKETTTTSKNPNICWQVFVRGSYRSEGVGKPFGFLKTTTTGTGVNLFIMAYNYPVILDLLEEQKADARIRNNPDWRRRLDQYIDSCPSYYRQHLRKALLRFKLTGGFMEEQPQPLYPAPILTYLAKCKHLAKACALDEELELRCGDIGVRLRQPPLPPNYFVSIERRSPFLARKNYRIEREQDTAKKITAREEVERKDKKRGSRSLPVPQHNRPAALIDDDMPDDPEAAEPAVEPADTYPKNTLDLGTTPLVDSFFRNPYSIRRDHLVHALPRLHRNLDQQLTDLTIPVLEGGLPGTQTRLQNAYELHSLPVGQMGNYDDYVKALEANGMAPMREVEPKAFREHAFGNPFKKDKKALAVDEVAEAPSASAAMRDLTGMTKKDRREMEAKRPPRRKAGPLAANSMQVWRERRRTSISSGASSVLSDISHTEDDLTEDLAEAEQAASGTDVDSAMDAVRLSIDKNGGDAKDESASGASTDSGITEWGLDEEAEEDEEIDDDDGGEGPARKKAKLVIDEDAGNGSGETNGVDRRELSVDEMRDLKGRVSTIVRLIQPDDKVYTRLAELLGPLTHAHAAIVARYAREESMRFRKSKLSASLEARMRELESQSNGV